MPNFRPPGSSVRMVIEGEGRRSVGSEGEGGWVGGRLLEGGGGGNDSILVLT